MIKRIIVGENGAKIDGVSYDKGIYYIEFNDDRMNITGDYDDDEIYHNVLSQYVTRVNNRNANIKPILDDYSENIQIEPGKSKVFELFPDKGFIHELNYIRIKLYHISSATSGNIEVQFVIKDIESDGFITLGTLSAEYDQDINFNGYGLNNGNVHNKTVEEFTKILYSQYLSYNAHLFIEIRNNTNVIYDDLIPFKAEYKEMIVNE